MPYLAAYGVPGLSQVTWSPSPMSHAMRDALAVMVTVMPPPVALADCGPQVPALTVVHSHTGRPTAPVPFGCGAIPICAPNRWIFANAWAASWAGVGPTAALSIQRYICVTAQLPGAV